MIELWVARDSSGTLYLHASKPERRLTYWAQRMCTLRINKDDFPDLKWEDEPIMVTLTKIG
jgi:hypothetical protein